MAILSQNGHGVLSLLLLVVFVVVVGVGGVGVGVVGVDNFFHRVYVHNV